ncbi:HEAT repeat domain-containing protein [bacterium]|nr:HEAT repeat domain-containing protein [bacterium]
MADAKKDKKTAPEFPEPLACIAKLPGDDREAADAVCRELMAGGAERIVQLIAIVGEFGVNEGVKPRYALHALASYCSRKGAEEERNLFAATLAEQIAAKHSASVKAFLVRQLALTGTPAETPALAKLVPDPRLGLPAVAALISIGDESAAAALRAALPATKGRTRIGILQGLGRLGDVQSVPALIGAATDKDRDTRLTALHALAAVGSPKAIDTLEAAAAVESPYERTQGLAACLTLASRLRERGDEKSAVAVYQHLLDSCKEKHVRHAATEGLKTKKGASQ